MNIVITRTLKADSTSVRQRGIISKGAVVGFVQIDSSTGDCIRNNIIFDCVPFRAIYVNTIINVELSASRRFL